MPLTLYEKIWNAHLVKETVEGEALLYIDRHLLHEVSTPQAFVAERLAGRKLRRPKTHLAVADHAVPTRLRGPVIPDKLAAAQVQTLEQNASDFDIPYLALSGEHQGIVHVVGPEQGFTLPGVTLVCGDSHTTTHGAFGALAFGIGASECGTVMATQCIKQKKSKTMRVTLTGQLSDAVSAKDVALAFIAKVGTGGVTGYAVEYAGPAIDKMSMAARMTICNMSIEAGSRIGLVAPDKTTFDYVKGRKMAPKGKLWDEALSYWKTLHSDRGAVFDKEVMLDLSKIAPHVTWGNSPEQAVPVDGSVPENAPSKPLTYMGLKAGQKVEGLSIDQVFIGSCTNGRIEDLRAAAKYLENRKIASHITAFVVPGSTQTKLQAEKEGLDKIFLAAGFEWHHAGCSMCVAMNEDRLKPGQRCASTSNRNFEGRQGPGSRTHLMSPAMAAAAAVAGHIVDIRTL